MTGHDSHRDPGTHDGARVEPVTTFAAAHNLNAYELARTWAGMVGLDRSSPTDQLAELATMRALTDWLTRWTPIVVNRALLAGATVEQVCAAYGATSPAYELATPAEVAEVWRTWADGQRRLRERYGDVGMTADGYAQVAAILDAATAPKSAAVRVPMTGPYWIHPSLKEWPNPGTWTVHYAHPQAWGDMPGVMRSAMFKPGDGGDVLAMATEALADAGYLLVGEWRSGRIPGGPERYDGDAQPKPELAALAEARWADGLFPNDIAYAVTMHARHLAAGGAS